MPYVVGLFGQRVALWGEVRYCRRMKNARSTLTAPISFRALPVEDRDYDYARRALDAALPVRQWVVSLAWWPIGKVLSFTDPWVGRIYRVKRVNSARYEIVPWSERLGRQRKNENPRAVNSIPGYWETESGYDG